MTCCVAVRHAGQTLLMADSAGTCADETLTIVEPKVCVKDTPDGVKIGLAMCGSFRPWQLIQHVTNLPAFDGSSNMSWLVRQFVPTIMTTLSEGGCLLKTRHDEVYTDTQLLVAFNTGIYVVESNFQVMERPESFNAIGAGATLAFGALSVNKGSARKRAEQALQVAAKYNNTVAGPFTSVTI